MSYKLKEQVIKRFGTDLPRELAYNIHLKLNANNAKGFVDELIKAHSFGKDYFVVPQEFVSGNDDEDFVRVLIEINSDWFEEVNPFEPREYQWYEISKAPDAIIEEDDTILTRNWLGKIEIAKNKDELLTCNKAVISQFLIIHSDVPF